MILRSAFTRAMLFLFASAVAVQAHPGHPGHDDDPYRMEGLQVPFPEIGFFLPLLALGAGLALLQGKLRTVLAAGVVTLLVITGGFHAQDGKAFAGLMASAACALAAGAIPARAVVAARRAAASRK